MEKEIILVVNGDPEMLESMVGIVSSLGFPCLSAEDVGPALDLVRQQKVDLVITDVQLPSGDGLAFMEEVRACTTDAAFIVVTGFSEEYNYSRIIGAGADDFIRKPFTPEQFKNKLQRILAQRRLEFENLVMIRQLERLNKRLANLLDFASDLTSELDVDRLFPLIVGKVTEAMGAERTSLYVIDWEKKDLWTKVAEQVEDFRLPLGQGISGRVAETGESINVENARELPYFNSDFDRKHNFRTRSVLCLPVRNQTGDRIGVIQVINKIGRPAFIEDDETLLRGLASQVGIALENSLLHDEVRLSFDSSIRALSATVDARHPLTAGHSQRVTEYSLLIAGEIGLSATDREVLRLASLLHDIGKIGISDQVLLKDGPYTPEERREMNTHTEKTREILEKFHFPKSLREVPEVAVHHHEMMDGQGYPDGLTGNELHLGSRIMAVADVFDALTSCRDYPKYYNGVIMSRDPMPIKMAVEILKNGAGRQFDPDVVQSFLKCLPKALRLFRGTHFSPEYVDEIVGLNELKEPAE